MPTNLPRELLDLRRTILTMGALVDSRVQHAVDAVVHRDAEEANAIRHGDRAVDEMEIDIEQHCIEVLALLQPVARDLRFVLAVLRINGELERIADLAKGIAKRVLHLKDRTGFELPDTLSDMAGGTREMFANCLRALSDEDVALAQQVRRDDLTVDKLEKRLGRWAQEILADKGSAVTEAVIDVISIIRSLERMADMCTNIAEDVVFLVEGEVVRHTDL